MFEQAFKNIDDVLWKQAGCTTELDYTEQTSWLLFLRYLDGLEEDQSDKARLEGKKYSYILVGIENTKRRRDLTGPTSNEDDRKIAPKVGESAAFRAFIRTELMPAVTARYRTTGETAIMGESLAGLFVVETLLVEPSLFDTYIAFDPSVWWNNGGLVKTAPAQLRAIGNQPKTLYVASSRDDRDGMIKAFADMLKQSAPTALKWHYTPMPEETHATIYHPAALKALRVLFKPAEKR